MSKVSFPSLTSSAHHAPHASTASSHSHPPVSSLSNIYRKSSATAGTPAGAAAAGLVHPHPVVPTPPKTPPQSSPSHIHAHASTSSSAAPSRPVILTYETDPRVVHYSSDADRRTVYTYLSSSACHLFTPSRMHLHSTQLDALFDARHRTAASVIYVLRAMDEAAMRFSEFGTPGGGSSGGNMSAMLPVYVKWRQRVERPITPVLPPMEQKEHQPHAHGSNSIIGVVPARKSPRSKIVLSPTSTVVSPSSAASPAAYVEQTREAIGAYWQLRALVLRYLTSPDSRLFAGVDGGMSVSDLELDALLENGPYTLYHLQHLNALGHTFPTFTALTAAVCAFQARSLAAREQLYHYLNHASCPILPRPRARFRWPDIDALFVRGGAGEHTMPLLRDMERASVLLHPPSITTIIAAVKQAHTAATRRAADQAHRMAKSPAVYGRAEHADMLPIRTEQDIHDQAALEREAAAEYAATLAARSNAGVGVDVGAAGGETVLSMAPASSASSPPALVAGSGAPVEQTGAATILAWLGGNECLLFAAALPITAAELRALVEAATGQTTVPDAGTGMLQLSNDVAQQTLRLLRALNLEVTASTVLPSMSALIDRVALKREECMQTAAELLALVQQHRFLLYQRSMSDDETRRLIEAAAVDVRCLEDIRSLVENHAQFASIDELLTGMARARAQRAAVMSAYETQLHTYLSDTYPSPAVLLFSHTFVFTSAHLSQLLSVGRTGLSTIRHLQYLVELQRTAARQRDASAVASKIRLVKPGTNADGQLELEDDDDDSRGERDALALHPGVYSGVPALCMALRHLVTRAETMQIDMLQFLQSAQCHLFTPELSKNEMESKSIESEPLLSPASLTMRDMQTLFECDSGHHTLPLLHKMSTAKLTNAHSPSIYYTARRYRTLDDLCQALKLVYTRELQSSWSEQDRQTASRRGERSEADTWTIRRTHGGVAQSCPPYPLSGADSPTRAGESTMPSTRAPSRATTAAGGGHHHLAPSRPRSRGTGAQSSRNRTHRLAAPAPSISSARLNDLSSWEDDVMAGSGRASPDTSPQLGSTSISASLPSKPAPLAHRLRVLTDQERQIVADAIHAAQARLLTPAAPGSSMRIDFTPPTFAHVAQASDPAIETWFALTQLQRSGRWFGDMESLLAALSAERMAFARRKADMWAYMRNRGSSLLEYEWPLEQDKEEHETIGLHLMARLEMESGAAPHTLAYLKCFPPLADPFDLEQLVEAIRQRVAEQPLTEEEVAALLEMEAAERLMEEEDDALARTRSDAAAAAASMHQHHSGVGGGPMYRQPSVQAVPDDDQLWYADELSRPGSPGMDDAFEEPSPYDIIGMDHGADGAKVYGHSGTGVRARAEDEVLVRVVRKKRPVAQSSGGEYQPSSASSSAYPPRHGIDTTHAATTTATPTLTPLQLNQLLLSTYLSSEVCSLLTPALGLQLSDRATLEQLVTRIVEVAGAAPVVRPASGTGTTHALISQLQSLDRRPAVQKHSVADLFSVLDDAAMAARSPALVLLQLLDLQEQRYDTPTALCEAVAGARQRAELYQGRLLKHTQEMAEAKVQAQVQAQAKAQLLSPHAHTHAHSSSSEATEERVGGYLVALPSALQAPQSRLLTCVTTLSPLLQQLVPLCERLSPDLASLRPRLGHLGVALSQLLEHPDREYKALLRASAGGGAGAGAASTYYPLLSSFLAALQPFFADLRPVMVQLQPTFEQLHRLLKGAHMFYADLHPFLTLLQPLARAQEPVLDQVLPLVRTILACLAALHPALPALQPLFAALRKLVTQLDTFLRHLDTLLLSLGPHREAVARLTAAQAPISTTLPAMQSLSVAAPHAAATCLQPHDKWLTNLPSYLSQLRTFCTELPPFIDAFLPFVAQLPRSYSTALRPLLMPLCPLVVPLPVEAVQAASLLPDEPPPARPSASASASAAPAASAARPISTGSTRAQVHRVSSGNAQVPSANPSANASVSAPPASSTSTSAVATAASSPPSTAAAQA